MSYKIELAKISDTKRISELINNSVWALSSKDYTKNQINAALSSVWGVDTPLLHDKTYFCIWSNGELVGCGGWSFRKTLFGSDGRKDRDTSCLDSSIDAAKIRAFFIHPNHSRKGLGSMLLNHCERLAWNAGFRRMELGATLPGMRLYLKHQYIPSEPYEFNTSPTTSLTIIPMSKKLNIKSY